ncbi:hypothetical protein QE447_002101 [Stenotrophomonas sp. SORGH_AS282]|nr:hypothetical protein [Stenotrophomonas sp. SORGH_AS_0282]
MLGLSGVPDAGDDFVVVEDERLAKDVAQQRETKRRESRLVQSAGSRMEDIMATLGKGDGQQVLNLVIKADVQGSVQALSQALVALSNDDIRINVIHSGVGGITESDANSAVASKATVIGFNVRADASARRIIESNGVDLRYFSIIYDVIDQVKQVASGLLGVDNPRRDHRYRPGPRRVPQLQVRCRGRLYGHRRYGQAQQADPRPARQRGGVRRRAGIAASLQGERRRSPQRYRMRYRREGLQRCEAGRPDRVLRAYRSAAHPVM